MCPRSNPRTCGGNESAGSNSIKLGGNPLDLFTFASFFKTLKSWWLTVTPLYQSLCANITSVIMLSLTYLILLGLPGSGKDQSQPVFGIAKLASWFCGVAVASVVSGTIPTEVLFINAKYRLTLRSSPDPLEPNACSLPGPLSPHMRNIPRPVVCSLMSLYVKCETIFTPKPRHYHVL